MFDEKRDNGIGQTLQAESTINDVKQTLRNSGWNDQKIEQSLKELKGNNQSNTVVYSIFLFVIVLSILFVGGIVSYFFLNNASNELVSVMDTEKKNESIDGAIITPEQGGLVEEQQDLLNVPTPVMDKNIELTIRILQEMLECHYQLNTEYPLDWLMIDELKCSPSIDFRPPEYLRDWDNYNYTNTDGGQGYYFEIPTQTVGKGYIVTHESIEYLEIPEEIIIESYASARDDHRKSDLYAITNAVYQYAVENNGDLPNSISTIPTDVGRDGLNLEKYLVPLYIAEIPFDPSTGTAKVTNYLLFSEGGNRVVASASGELVPNITIKR